VSARTKSVLGGLLVALLVVATWLLQGHDDGADRPPGSSGLPTIQQADLPREAVETLELIDAGGPYPYPDRDGATFGNYEGLLPAEPSGYYAEYTVPTPGSPDRGPRRIVAGDGGELYWTADHYASFEQIVRPPGG
jgi:ribonuclease T1